MSNFETSVCLHLLLVSLLYQETALHNAASHNQIEIVKYLVGKQPDININIQNVYWVSVVMLPGVVFLNWPCQPCLNMCLTITKVLSIELYKPD